MRLLDQISQWREPLLIQHPTLGVVRLPGVERLAAPIANAEIRYILRDDVARACASLVYDQPSLLLDSIDLIRLPAETMWIEWFDRAIVRPGADPSVSSRRAGFYVCTDASGRKGTIRSAWELAPGRPDRSPAEIEFDLDARLFTRRGDPSAHPVRVDQNGMLTPFHGHLRMRVDDDWARYYRACSADLAGTLDDVEKTVGSDALLLFAFCLLFTMRGEIRLQTADLDRLNRARGKRRQPLLLDYREVSAMIFADPATGRRDADERRRAGARLHYVRGHFVRRDAAIFWRSPHLRGDASRGVAACKNVRLGLGRAPTSLQGLN
jgi:hypothetical protein